MSKKHEMWVIVSGYDGEFLEGDFDSEAEADAEIAENVDLLGGQAILRSDYEANLNEED